MSRQYSIELMVPWTPTTWQCKINLSPIPTTRFMHINVENIFINFASSFRIMHYYSARQSVVDWRKSKKLHGKLHNYIEKWFIASHLHILVFHRLSLFRDCYWRSLLSRVHHENFCRQRLLTNPISLPQDGETWGSVFTKDLLSVLWFPNPRSDDWIKILLKRVLVAGLSSFPLLFITFGRALIHSPWVTLAKRFHVRYDKKCVLRWRSPSLARISWANYYHFSEC